MKKLVLAGTMALITGAAIANRLLNYEPAEKETRQYTLEDGSVVMGYKMKDNKTEIVAVTDNSCLAHFRLSADGTADPTAEVYCPGDKLGTTVKIKDASRLQKQVNMAAEQLRTNKKPAGYRTE